MKLGLHVKGNSSCLLCAWQFREDSTTQHLVRHLREHHLRTLLSKSEDKRRGSDVTRITIHGVYWPNEVK